MAEYVDRDLLKEKLFRAIGASPDGNCGNCECDERECMFIKCFTRMDVCEKIEDELLAAPTADVRPVVRGHWITEEEAEAKGDYSLRDACSVCGRCDWDCTESASFNYCPNCGADMREGS